MASLPYLKRTFQLSGEALVQRWAKNIVWDFFSGMTYYEPRLPCNATRIARLRAAVGTADVEKSLNATIGAAAPTKAIRPP